MNKIRVGALALAGFVAVGSATAAEWSVVDETSAVKFSAVQQGTRFSGAFREFEAQISLDPQDPTQGSIVGVVQTESVSTRDHDRDAALADTDWFNIREYPEARFESESIEKADEGGYVANGSLTLKGKTNPAQMHFTLEPGADGEAKFMGTMTVNRFDYDVGQGWNDTSWIGQDVDVEVDLTLSN